MCLKNKSILVTGGAGFIGSHLVDRLIKEEPENLVVADNFFLGKESNLRDGKISYKNIKIYKQDVGRYEEMKMLIEKENIEVIFNLAVVPLLSSLTKPRWTFEENVNITLSLCDLARNDYFKTLIHFSSSEVYGTSEYAPMDEKHPMNGTTPYAASKAASDQVIMAYFRTFGIDASIIRPFNNFGPRQNEGSYAGVIPLTIKRIMNGESPVICGDGNQTRDYLFVTDTVDAAIEIYNHKNTRSKAINIASGKEIRIRKIIEAIHDYLDCQKPIIYKKVRQGEVRRHIANISLAEDLIGFKPIVEFNDGLRKTINWYKENQIA
jgi:UDP-glucose 4-epimerase